MISKLLISIKKAMKVNRCSNIINIAITLRAKIIIIIFAKVSKIKALIIMLWIEVHLLSKGGNAKRRKKRSLLLIKKLELKIRIIMIKIIILKANLMIRIKFLWIVLTIIY
jgi:hypothetical protein